MTNHPRPTGEQFLVFAVMIIVCSTLVVVVAILVGLLEPWSPKFWLGIGDCAFLMGGGFLYHRMLKAWAARAELRALRRLEDEHSKQRASTSRSKLIT